MLHHSRVLGGLAVERDLSPLPSSEKEEGMLSGLCPHSSPSGSPLHTAFPLERTQQVASRKFEGPRWGRPGISQGCKISLRCRPKQNKQEKTNPLICLLVIRKATFESLQYFDFSNSKSRTEVLEIVSLEICVLLTWG